MDILEDDMADTNSNYGEIFAEWRGHIGTRVTALENEFRAFQHRQEADMERFRQQFDKATVEVKGVLSEKIAALAEAQRASRVELQLNMERMHADLRLELTRSFQEIAKVKQELTPIQRWVFIAMGVILLATFLIRSPLVSLLFGQKP